MPPSPNTPTSQKQTAPSHISEGRVRRGGWRYHGKAGKQGRCPAGSLQLGPAQVQLPPGERLEGVLVQTHRVASSSRSKRSWTSGDDVVSPNTRPTTSPAGRVALANKCNSKWPAGATAEAAASLPCLSLPLPPPSHRVYRACCTTAADAPYTTHNAVRCGKKPSSACCCCRVGFLVCCSPHTLPRADKLIQPEAMNPSPFLILLLGLLLRRLRTSSDATSAHVTQVKSRVQTYIMVRLNATMAGIYFK